MTPLINSGTDAGLMFLAVWLLAALGGWCVGTTAYYFQLSRNWVWRHLDTPRRVLLCVLGVCIGLLAIILLPATLPSAHSAWCWHNMRRCRIEKMRTALRSLTKLRRIAPPRYS